MKILFPLALILVGPVFSSLAEDVWLGSEEYNRLQVIITGNATSYERDAASEFVSYWEKCTGFKPTISESPGDGVSVYVGINSLPEDVRKQIDLASLEPDGVFIKTFDSMGERGKALVIAGAGDRGTQNAVYEFFERYIGVRWLSDGVIFIPRPPSQSLAEILKPWERATPSALPHMDFSYKSPFVYRWTTASNAKELRLTTYPDFGLFVHTFYTLLPPDEYFPEHPEYYSEIDGKRIAPAGLGDLGRFFYDEDFRAEHAGQFGQLCVTNPELPEVVAENLLKRIRANPKPLIWSVSQNDCGNYCQCAECKKLEDAEGTPMAPLLAFVNKVAEIVEREFPDHYIETLAYTWSRRVPKTIKPRHNVIIRLCSIECDFARPLDDPNAPSNVLFARDIEEWSQTARQLYVWDYTVNFKHYFLPHPNLRVLQENIRFFAQHNVRGVFEQGEKAPMVELGHVRPYLLARLLWNPDLDVQAAQNEFLDLFYQEAAPSMKKYLDLIHTAVLKSGFKMDTFDDGAWLSLDVLEEARRLMDEGIAAAASEEVRRRVEYEKLAVEYASLVLGKKFSVEGDYFVLTYPQSMTPSAFVELAKTFGVPNFSETKRIEDLPRYVEAHPEGSVYYPVHKIRNERYELWAVPGWRGSVIRWRDNGLGIELFSGYRTETGQPRVWQDWDSRQKPAAEQYTVERQDDHTLTLSAVTKKGLAIRRTMSLPAGSDRLIVELEMKNPANEPVGVLVKQHPEFYLQGTLKPDIRGLTAKGWEPLNKTSEEEELSIVGDVIPAANYRGLACFIPEKEMTIVCAFEPLPDAQLLWYANVSPDAQHVNLELLPPPKPLAPGESLVLRGEFYVTRQKLWE